MTELRRVAVFGPSERGEATHLPALRSLPKRWRLVAAEDAGVDVLVVSAPVDALDRAVVVDRPTVGVLDAISAARVYVPSPLVDDPGWAVARSLIGSLADSVFARASFLIGGRDGTAADATSLAGDRQPLRDAVEDVCAVVLDTFTTVEVEHSVVCGRDGVDALLRADGLPVAVTVTRLSGGPSERRFEVLGPTGHVSIDFPSPYLFGAPATVHRHDVLGTFSPAPIRENGWRAAWRRISDDLASGGAPSRDDVTRARRAIALADQVLEPA